MLSPEVHNAKFIHTGKKGEILAITSKTILELCDT